jgi:pimeloyl-ACP methyl ester carboxylesterase
MRDELGTEAAELHTVTIHGRVVAYRQAGKGPVVVLVHGIAGTSSTWQPLMAMLAEHATVIAVDLAGHGGSAAPAGDYSLGAQACMIRDLLDELGHDKATFIGHSLGGGIVMQLGYQFPERIERIGLVASGGLGKEVHALLRLASLPFVEHVLPLGFLPPVQRTVAGVDRFLGRLGLRSPPAATEVAAAYLRLGNRDAQRAFLHTIRSVIDHSGQRVSAQDRLHLAAQAPTLIVWGERDSILPVAHGRAAHELMPGSRLEVLRGAGHFLPLERPGELSQIVADWLATTEPASFVKSARGSGEASRMLDRAPTTKEPIDAEDPRVG